MFRPGDILKRKKIDSKTRLFIISSDKQYYKFYYLYKTPSYAPDLEENLKINIERNFELESSIFREE